MPTTDPSRFRLLAEVWKQNTPACVFGLDGRHLDVNDACGEVFGYSRDEMLNMLAGDLTVETGRSGTKRVAAFSSE